MPSATVSLQIRAATKRDWPEVWSFLHPIVAAGETYTLDRELDEAHARALWMPPLPWHTVVAVVTGGRVLGSAKMGPNKGGPGAHVANASFMVDPAFAGLGIGHALGEHVIGWAREAGYRAMQFNAVVETNTRAVALWHSLGFEVIGTVPEGFNHPVHGLVDLHIMYRRL